MSEEVVETARKLMLMQLTKAGVISQDRFKELFDYDPMMPGTIFLEPVVVRRMRAMGVPKERAKEVYSKMVESGTIKNVGITPTSFQGGTYIQEPFTYVEDKTPPKQG